MKYNKDNLDYDELGLKVGLEIHQQLNTSKLFCSCSSDFDEEDNDFDRKVIRRLNVVEGELGDVDKAAKFEKSKKKRNVYHFYHENCCLVELDEEPPHKPSKTALNVSFGVSKALNVDIFDEIQVMRKIVLDGSNTSGFQRTMLIGKDGWFEINLDDVKKVIEIESICLEEDSSKIVEKSKLESVYDLRRLGIPLIEIATAPTINHPDEAKLAAEKLGLILRSFNVKRGLGSIRQDLNVSIENGNRVEIKGAQDLKNLNKYVENEVLRQKRLKDLSINLNDNINKENLEKSIEVFDVKDIFSNTSSKILKSIIDKKGIIKALKIPNFNGILGKKLCENRRVGTEISDYAKQSGINGLFHSDEKLKKYGISKEEIEVLESRLKISKDDAYIIVAEKKEIIKKAIPLIKERILMLFDGVISEVRKANQDFSNEFLRPMPGNARMYPETDILPIKPYDVNLPKLLPERIDEYIKMGLSEEQAKNVAKLAPNLFESLIQLAKPTFVFEKLISVSQDFDLDNKLIQENLKDVFMLFKKKKITKSAIDKIISFIDSKDIINEIENEDLLMLSGDNLEKKVKKLVKTFRDQMGKDKDNAIFGRVMSKAKFFGNPQEVIKILNEVLDR